jgi:hypothetical protein
MKAWLKGGLIGLVVGGLLELILAWIVVNTCPSLMICFPNPKMLSVAKLLNYFIPVIAGIIIGAFVWHIKSKKEVSKNVK